MAQSQETLDEEVNEEVQAANELRSELEESREEYLEEKVRKSYSNKESHTPSFFRRVWHTWTRRVKGTIRGIDPDGFYVTLTVETPLGEKNVKLRDSSDYERNQVARLLRWNGYQGDNVKELYGMEVTLRERNSSWEIAIPDSFTYGGIAKHRLDSFLSYIGLPYTHKISTLINRYNLRKGFVMAIGAWIFLAASAASDAESEGGFFAILFGLALLVILLAIPIPFLLMVYRAFAIIGSEIKEKLTGRKAVEM